MFSPIQTPADLPPQWQEKYRRWADAIIASRTVASVEAAESEAFKDVREHYWATFRELAEHSASD